MSYTNNLFKRIKRGEMSDEEADLLAGSLSSRQVSALIKKMDDDSKKRLDVIRRRHGIDKELEALGVEAASGMGKRENPEMVHLVLYKIKFASKELLLSVDWNVADLVSDINEAGYHKAAQILLTALNEKHKRFGLPPVVVQGVN